MMNNTTNSLISKYSSYVLSISHLHQNQTENVQGGYGSIWLSEHVIS